MITAFTTLNDVLFSEMIHPTYTYGEEGYVFFDYTDEIVDQEFIESFCQYLRMAQDYLETRGIPFLYCLNPAKTTVYAAISRMDILMKTNSIQRCWKPWSVTVSTISRT